jgi:hypothetical protein
MKQRTLFKQIRVFADLWVPKTQATWADALWDAVGLNDSGVGRG